jgi:hypothetical protein
MAQRSGYIIVITNFDLSSRGLFVDLAMQKGSGFWQKEITFLHAGATLGYQFPAVMGVDTWYSVDGAWRQESWVDTAKFMSR